TSGVCGSVAVASDRADVESLELRYGTVIALREHTYLRNERSCGPSLFHACSAPERSFKKQLAAPMMRHALSGSDFDAFFAVSMALAYCPCTYASCASCKSFSAAGFGCDDGASSGAGFSLTLAAGTAATAGFS